MNSRELEMALAAADPATGDRLDKLDFAGTDTELLADLDDEQLSASAPIDVRVARRRPRRRALALGAATAAVLVAAFFIAAGGSSEQASRAYGAVLVRFAESTPLLLLEGPGWRVQNVSQAEGPRRGEGLYGSMEFVTGKPVPYESVRITGTAEKQRAVGMLPPAVRQRRVELSWRQTSLESEIASRRKVPHPHGRREIELPVLDTTATVDTKAEFFVNQGGPGNRQMVALWTEGGYTLELRAAVPNLHAFEERLDWLTKVDSETWLDAMPAKVVKAADHDAAVREMLKGIPVPDTFSPSRVPDEGLTTNRYQVGAAVTGTVSCLWFRQWGEARRAGDKAAEIEAERAMATSTRWPILREMAEDGGYPPAIWQLAAGMPSGKGKRGWRLLPQAEALGCARNGIPVLPWKQRLQRERKRRET
jgi:hypothetical protein